MPSSLPSHLVEVLGVGDGTQNFVGDNSGIFPKSTPQFSSNHVTPQGAIMQTSGAQLIGRSARSPSGVSGPTSFDNASTPPLPYANSPRSGSNMMNTPSPQQQSQQQQQRENDATSSAATPCSTATEAIFNSGCTRTDIDDPITSKSQTAKLSHADEPRVETLVSFGFQEEVARKALKALEGEKEGLEEEKVVSKRWKSSIGREDLVARPTCHLLFIQVRRPARFRL